MTMKAILIGALGLLWIFGVSGQAQPLAQYTFNDGTPGDVSGNGLDGVLLGNAAIVTDPERGQVLQINQSGMQADGPFAITTSFTLSAWIKLDLPRTGRYYFGGPWWFRTDNEGSPEHFWIEVRYPEGNFLNKVDTRTTQNPQGQLDGQWHHLTLILPEDGAFRAYFDGVLAPFRDANPVRAHDFGGAIGPLFFGTQNEGGGAAIAGYMDDIRVYNYAVSDQEIPGLMTEGPGTEQAHDPQPENRAKGVPVVGTVLSWQTGLDPVDANFPNPAVTGHNLWLSIPYNPMNPPASVDWLDPGVQIFQIGADTNPADGTVDATASYSLALQRDALYYWIVDESLGAANPTDWDNIIQGSQWSFETVTSGPEVDAGSSIVTWLKGGTMTVDLNGTVTDATGDVTLIRWSVISSPSGSTVAIANNSVAATTTSFTETGRYILELYAKDAAQNEDSDMMEVYVYADSCEAAKNDPDGYTAPLYDFNDDCRVDFADFAMLAATWLEDESLAGDVLYDAGTIVLPPVVQFTNPLDGGVVSGEVIINAIAYDEAVGTTDGEGMLGAGYVFFEVIDSAGTVLDTQMENQAAFDMTWDTTLPLYPNGVYTIRVTAESDAGEQTIDEISVTVNN